MMLIKLCNWYKSGGNMMTKNIQRGRKFLKMETANVLFYSLAQNMGRNAETVTVPSDSVALFSNMF